MFDTGVDAGDGGTGAVSRDSAWALVVAPSDAGSSVSGVPEDEEADDEDCGVGPLVISQAGFAVAPAGIIVDWRWAVAASLVLLAGSGGAASVCPAEGIEKCLYLQESP